MSYNDIKISKRQSDITKAYVESAIRSYEESTRPAKKEEYIPKYQNEIDKVFEHTSRTKSVARRYSSFAESVRSSLVTEALYKLLECGSIHDKKDHASNSTLRSLISSYVLETGYDSILDKMKTASTTMCEMYIAINKASNRILESVDKTDCTTFDITPEQKDKFFKDLDYTDFETVSDAIRERVADAMDKFIEDNNTEHDAIEDILTKTQEKIATNPDDEEFVERCEMMAKRHTSEIRHSPKSVFYSIVSSLAESAVKANDKEFVNEGASINMDKIVNSSLLLYTFMEMLNTSNLEKMDKAYIESTIASIV